MSFLNDVDLILWVCAGFSIWVSSIPPGSQAHNYSRYIPDRPVLASVLILWSFLDNVEYATRVNRVCWKKDRTGPETLPFSFCPKEVLPGS